MMDKIDNGLLYYVQRDGLQVIGAPPIETRTIDVAAMEAAIGDAFKAGGNPNYFCIKGLWLAPYKHPGMVSHNCEDWREPTPDDRALLQPWLCAMSGLLR